MYSARKRRDKAELLQNNEEYPLEVLKMAKLEKLPLFDFRILRAATNDFNIANKLGRGGFGLVYKVSISCAMNFFQMISMTQ